MSGRDMGAFHEGVREKPAPLGNSRGEKRSEMRDATVDSGAGSARSVAMTAC